MRYATASAFRAALEARLNATASTDAVSLVRLRKLVVFDRLIARVLATSPGQWVVKGGVALEFRAPGLARSTKDLDLSRAASSAVAISELQAACGLDIGDHFRFTAREAGAIGLEDEPLAVRVHVRATLANRRFEDVVLDIGLSEPLFEIPDLVSGSGLLQFAGLPVIAVPTIPLDQHVAEKLHAYTQRYPGDRPTTRVKDLIDLALIPSFASFEGSRLLDACDRLFAARGTHPLPARLPAPPVEWTVAYRALASSVGLDADLAAGHASAARFLDPVLGGWVSWSRWDPPQGRWIGGEAS